MRWGSIVKKILQIIYKLLFLLYVARLVTRLTGVRPAVDLDWKAPDISYTTCSKLTHLPTHTLNPLIHPNPITPIPTPSNLNAYLINTTPDKPTYRHYHNSALTHKQKYYRENNHFKKKKTHSVQFTLSMHLNRH